MFRILVLQALNNLSDEQVEYQVRERLSSSRFLGLAIEDRIPDATTLWLFREKLAKAGIIVRARAKIGLQNLVYNIRRLVTLERLAAA